MKPLRVAGLCVLGLLLFCGASTRLVNAQAGPVIPEIEIPGTVYAGEDFYITLRVTRDSTVYSYAIGHFWVDETEEMPPGATPEPPPAFGISFGDELDWTFGFTMSFPSVGTHTLRFSVDYWLDAHWETTYPVSTPEISVDVVASKPTLTWLTPLSSHNSFEAGRTIPIRFSVHDDTGDFKRDESVTVTVRDAGGHVVFSASYGTHSIDVRIRESAEYYIVYWKTPRTLGPYTISVEFEGILVESLPIELR